jgi:putative FmdB family regulatory protein
MPIFDYECTKCGHKFIEVVELNSQKNPMCPKCGSKKTKKIFTAIPKITGLTKKS